MSQYKTTAIVLRTYDFKDYDKIVVLYSKEYGIIRAIAKGVKKQRSQFNGKLEPTISSKFILYKGKNLDIVNECDVIESFKGIRSSLKKLTFSLCYLELASAFGIEEDPNSEIYYDFLFDSLKKLELYDENSLIEKLLVEFEYNIISAAGYTPVFDTCNNCRKPIEESEYISFSSGFGMTICPECSRNISNLSDLSLGLYRYLRSLASNSSSNTNIDLITVTKAYSLLFDYISTKTNHKLKTPKLIESLCLS
ncbi:MAG: DNA repair protein RecO [Vampirovibrionia bacterium]